MFDISLKIDIVIVLITLICLCVTCSDRFDMLGLGFGGFRKTRSTSEAQISSRSVMDGLYFASQG